MKSSTLKNIQFLLDWELNLMEQNLHIKDQKFPTPIVYMVINTLKFTKTWNNDLKKTNNMLNIQKKENH